MSFRGLPSWKSAAAAGAMALGAETLDGCTFGPPAWRTPQMGSQSEGAVHEKLNNPRHRLAARELADLPQIELHHLQGELSPNNPGLTVRLQSIEMGAIAGNSFLHANASTPNTELERAISTIRAANMARTQVEAASLDDFFVLVRRHAQTDFNPEAADRLIRFMGGGLVQLPDTLNTEPNRVDHLQLYFTPEERSFLAQYLTQVLAERIQDPNVRLTVEQAGHALRATGDLQRPLLVALLREALQDGPLFETIRESVRRQQDQPERARLIARVIPSLRAGIFRAAVAAQQP